MPRQLNVRSDEAYLLARKLSQRTGLSTTVVVTEALRSYDAKTSPDLPPLPPNAKERYERLKALAHEVSRHVKPGTTSDHSDLYDDDGLPR